MNSKYKKKMKLFLKEILLRVCFTVLSFVITCGCIFYYLQPILSLVYGEGEFVIHSIQTSYFVLWKAIAKLGFLLINPIIWIQICLFIKPGTVQDDKVFMRAYIGSIVLFYGIYYAIVFSVQHHAVDAYLEPLRAIASDGAEHGLSVKLQLDIVDFFTWWVDWLWTLMFYWGCYAKAVAVGYIYLSRGAREDWILRRRLRFVVSCSYALYMVVFVSLLVILPWKESLFCFVLFVLFNEAMIIISALLGRYKVFIESLSKREFEKHRKAMARAHEADRKKNWLFYNIGLIFRALREAWVTFRKTITMCKNWLGAKCKKFLYAVFSAIKRVLFRVVWMVLHLLEKIIRWIKNLFRKK